MNEEANIIENEEITTNVITYENTTTTTYEVAKNINTVLNVLTFTIIIICLYKYLKTTFFIRK